MAGSLAVCFLTVIWICSGSKGDKAERTGDILVLFVPSPLIVCLVGRGVTHLEVPKQSFLGLGEPVGVTGQGAGSLSQLM